MMTSDCVGCNALTTMTDQSGRFLAGQTAAVVGPRFGGVTSYYHLAYGPRMKTLCGRPAPAIGWRVLGEQEESNGLCERCEIAFMPSSALNFSQQR